MTNPIGRPPASNVAFVPPQINSLEDTGLSPLWLQDLVLKVLYSRGYMTGFKISAMLLTSLKTGMTTESFIAGSLYCLPHGSLYKAPVAMGKT